MLTADGWGPLRVGMSLAEVTRALGPDSDPDAVGGPDPAQCDEFRPQRAPENMLVMIERGRLTRISLINASRIRTDRGIGLGDPAGAVRTAYPIGLIATPDRYQPAPAQTLVAWARGGEGATGQTVLSNPEARGIAYQIDPTQRVRIISAGGPSIQYAEGCA